MLGLMLGLSLTSGQGGGGNFPVSDLFADGSDGAWFDFSKSDRLFQESTGVTAVALAGNPIGLAAEGHDPAWSGKTLSEVADAQPELLTNTDFATDTVWTKGTGWSIAAGKATHASGVSGGLDQAEAMASGHLYRIGATVADRTASSVAVQLIGGAAVSGASQIVNGPLLQHLRGTASHTTLRYLAGSTFDGSVDDASLKDIPGNAALQATAGSRPTWQSGGKIRGDGTDDNLLTALVAQSSENCILAAVTVPLTVSALMVIAGTAGAVDGRLWLGINTSGQVCGGVGTQTEATIVGTADLRGSTVVIGLSCDGTTVKLFSNTSQQYSGAQSGNPTTSVPFRLLALNNNGTAESFFGSDATAIIIGRKALTASEFSSISREILPEPTVLTGWVLALTQQTGRIPDYIVDPSSGSDGNSGSINAPWATLAPLRAAVEALPNNGTLTAFVKAGTYTDQHLDMWNTATTLDVLIGFEPGASLIEWSNSAIETRPGTCNAVQLGDAPTSSFEVYGNGLTVRGFDAGTGNGFGCYNLAMIVRDVTAEDCVDGITTHGSGTIEAHDSVFRDCNKAASDNVGSGGIECYNCQFIGRAAATAGIMRMSDTTTGYFEDCTFTPAAANQVMTPKDCEFVRGAIGTADLVVNIATSTPNLVISPETFVNINYT